MNFSKWRIVKAYKSYSSWYYKNFLPKSRECAEKLRKINDFNNRLINRALLGTAKGVIGLLALFGISIFLIIAYLIVHF